MSDSQPSTSTLGRTPVVKPAPKQTTKPKRTPQQSKNLRGRPTDPLPTRVSKTLAYLLRHGAEKEALAIRPDGYLLVDELLAHPSLKLNGVDLRQLELIVADDAKSRYSLTQFPSAPASIGSPSSASSPAGQSSQASAAADGLLVWYIRANQGHSLELNEMEAEMRRVERVESAGLAVHGTYEKHWPSIYETGLQKMTRQHIHLALTLPSSSKQTISAIDNGEPNQSSQQKTVSGIRPSADLYIYLDVPLLLSQGVPLFLSSNDVLLSPGDPASPGSIGRRFFLRAVKRSGELLWERP